MAFKFPHVHLNLQLLEVGFGCGLVNFKFGTGQSSLLHNYSSWEVVTNKCLNPPGCAV